jgi:hypothetical protein
MFKECVMIVKKKLKIIFQDLWRPKRGAKMGRQNGNYGISDFRDCFVWFWGCFSLARQRVLAFRPTNNHRKAGGPQQSCPVLQ